jgi:hypothetical protein
MSPQSLPQMPFTNSLKQLGLAGVSRRLKVALCKNGVFLTFLPPESAQF